MWYLAELLVEIRVEADDERALQFELYLVQAHSAGDAYEKAMRIGNEKNKQYLRRDGALIEFEFRGLNDLSRVEEELQDGARLLNRTQYGLSAEQIVEFVTPREKLRAVQAEGIAGGGDTLQ